MPLAVAIRFNFLDAKGKTSFTKVRVPSTFSIAQYAEFGVAMGQFIANISSCSLTGASATITLDLSGLAIKAVAATIADTAQKGYFSFLSTATRIFKRIRIPTFNETKVSSNSDNINTLDTQVQAFTSAMTNGIVTPGGTIAPVTERGYDITAVSDAREVFRKHR